MKTDGTLHRAYLTNCISNIPHRTQRARNRILGIDIGVKT